MEDKSKEEKIESEQSTIPKKTNILPTIKVVWKVIEKILMVAIVFICAVIITQYISKNDKSFLGFRIFRVQTGSMIPKYQVGDVIIIKEKNIDKIKVGDDVTYWGTEGTMKDKLVTHQVIQIEEVDGEKVFHTKGIANNLEDPVISGDQINGVVLGKMLSLTAITLALSNKYIFYFCGIIPLTIFVFLAFVKSNVKKFEEYK